MSIGIFNVMCLGCDLFCVVMASSVVVAASLGTLNSKITNHFDEVYESRI